ncbi:MAG: thioredoxin reductase [Chthoniobacter sp.]|nr:thioredoxin reductase [Chthoniobacter sp.]
MPARSTLNNPAGCEWFAMSDPKKWEVVIVGAGMAGLSAGIYLGRAQRDALIVSAGNSMAAWEPDVQNYLGFPDGIAGEKLLARGRQQAGRYGISFAEAEIDSVTLEDGSFLLKGKTKQLRARKVLLATGIFHLPPEIPGVKDCLGHSMFFCKDCDGYRLQGKRIAIFGANNEAVEYALGMLHYSACVLIALHGREPTWSAQHADWLREYEIPVYPQKISDVDRDGCKLLGLKFAGSDHVAVDALFTTRGDIFYNELAKTAGAAIDEKTGEICTNDCLMTSVPGLYAAGCVTAANCQMIIAAGQGAIAAQAINRALFEESLRDHGLRRHRDRQIREEETTPHVVTPDGNAERWSG